MTFCKYCKTRQLLGIKNLVMEVFQAIITWAVAGRHVEKLKIILKKAEKVSGKYCCLDWLFR